MQKVFNFDEIYFIFFPCFCFGIIFKKLLPNSRFFSCFIIVIAFTFIYLILFELIFVYGVK